MFMPTSGEVSAVAAIIGSILSFMGITHIDAATISSAANGLISLATIVFAIYAYFQHRKLAQQQAQS